MASPTHKVDRIRNRKKTAMGQRRKREIRQDLRKRIVAVGQKLGLGNPDALLATEEAK